MKKISVILLIMLLSVFVLGNIVEKRVDIDGGDYMIPGIFSMPENYDGNVPAVLMIHGFASQKDEVGNMYKNLAAELAELGYASLRIDFPGAGDHQESFVKTSLTGQIEDSRVAYNWLLKQPEVDTDRTGVVGFSFGGVVASCLAGSEPNINALALWSTPGDPSKSLLDIRDAEYPTAVEEGHVIVDLGWTKIDMSKEFFQSQFVVFPMDSIRYYESPLLIIAGEVDDNMPADAHKYAKNAASMDITLRIIPGADHIYHVLTEDQTDANFVIDLTAGWFADKL